MTSIDPQGCLQSGLLEIAMHHVAVGEQVSRRVAAARQAGTEPTLADRSFLQHWLQVLDVLAVVTSDQPHPDLKGLAARLDELTDLVRLQVMS